MFGKSEKSGKVQKFVGDSSQEEQNMAATVKLGVCGRGKKMICTEKCSVGRKLTHTIQNGKTGLKRPE
jgi:hypothetical protein